MDNFDYVRMIEEQHEYSRKIEWRAQQTEALRAEVKCWEEKYANLLKCRDQQIEELRTEVKCWQEKYEKLMGQYTELKDELSVSQVVQNQQVPHCSTGNCYEANFTIL